MSVSVSVRTSIDLQVFEAMPGNSIVLLPNSPLFTIVAVTDDYQKTFRRSKEQLINIGMFDAFPEAPDDSQQTGVKQFRASLEKAIQQKVPDQMPLVRDDLANEDGTFSERYWSAVNKPVIGQNGEVSYIIHTAVEMTLQGKTEHPVNRISSLETSYDLFMQVPVTIGVVKGPEYIIELANDNLLEIWGRTAEVLGKSLFEAIPELKEQGFKELLDQVIQTGNPYHGHEYPILLKRQGKEAVFYFDFVYKPYYENGQIKPVGVLAVGHNVTRQVESRHKFKAVIEEAKDPILILMGEDLVLDTANQALFDLWQVGSDAIGKTFLELLPEMKDQGFHDLLLEVLHTGEPFYGQEVPATFTRKSGVQETVYFDFSYQPYRNVDGSIVGILVMARNVSVNVLARKKIEESEAYFRRLTDTVPAIIWITRSDGYCTYLNRNWYDYTGQTPGEAEGFGWLKATHPDDAKEAGRLFLEATEKQQPYSFLYRLRHKSGEYRWALDRGEPKFAPDGSFEGMIGTVLDVHEQKLAEDKIRESEKRFRSMADASPVMIWTLDENGNSTYYNSRAREFTGHTEDDLEQGRSWQVAIHPDDIVFAGGVVRNAAINRIPYQMECRMQRADGEWRWLLSHGTPRFGSEGEYFGFVGSSVDITDRKLAENAIIYRKALLEAQNNAIPDAILIVDTKGAMISFNHHFAKLWNIPKEIINAKDDFAALEFAMTQVSDPQAFRARVAYCYEHPDEIAHEEILLADGRIIERYGNAVTGDDGTNYGWIWYFRDITQQRHFTERLEKLVTERTKALQLSNDNLQQFAHVASHDLKEPVRKIKTFASRLENELQDVLDTKSRVYLDKVKKATDRMFIMIEGVLNFSTIDASK
ncbi:PAS domain S-box protein [Flavitalea antarctica]